MTFTREAMFGSATYSDDGVFRYELRRWWDASRPRLLVVMLNPSTATETHNDPTIRRCLSYAGDAGFGSLAVGNLYAYRATDPHDVETAGWTGNNVGTENDDRLRALAEEADLVWVAWGAHEIAAHRAPWVRRLLGSPLYCRGRTASGAPRHPLYVARCVPAERWS